MTQDERWISRYNEVKEFIEREHRNPSKYVDEERQVTGVEDSKRLMEDIPNKIRDVLGIMWMCLLR